MSDSLPDSTKRYASDCICVEKNCKQQAVAFFPVFDPDIPSYPYCRTCLDKVKNKLLIELYKIERTYQKKK